MNLDFKNLLGQTSLISDTVPMADEIYNNTLLRKQSGPIKIMYGETYDRLGPTLDSLKYYFTVAALGWTLRREMIEAQPTILIADVATCRNESNDQHDLLMELGKDRAAFARSVSETYNLGLKVMLMSEYLNTEEFQNRLERIRHLAKYDKLVHEWIKQTVPESKVDIEASKDFAYAFEEVATIVDYDIKVGPPREIFYDEPARIVGKLLNLEPLQSIYLYPTYPLGFGRSFFLANEEIEKYGVTPYKAGSKGLEANRIIVGKTRFERIEELVNQSVNSRNLAIPNSILDIAIISEFARQWLSSELEPISIREQFQSGKLSQDELREMALENLSRFIIDPLFDVI